MEHYDLYSSPYNFPGDQVMNNEMGGACGKYGRQERYSVMVGRPVGKRKLGRTGIVRNIILKWIFKKWDGEDELD